jgi:hypothetical protein
MFIKTIDFERSATQTVRSGIRTRLKYSGLIASMTQRSKSNVDLTALSASSATGGNDQSNFQKAVTRANSTLHDAVEDIKHDAERAGKLVAERVDRFRVLLTFDEVDPWMQSNRYIETGYRSNMSVSQILMSLFQPHNELINIWTHLLSAVWFVWLAYDDFQVSFVCVCVVT